MRYTSAIVLLVLTVIVSSFSSGNQAICRRTGISGHVYLESGNQMPSPDRQQSGPVGMKTTVYIYELTNISQVTRDGESPFYKSLSTRLVKEVETGSDGAFKVKLKPGTYSVFIKKGDLFYSNLFDGENNINPVEVKKGMMTPLDLKANYDAVY